MAIWAAVVAMALAALAYLAGGGDLSPVLSGALELGAVSALFTLVCATEASN